MSELLLGQLGVLVLCCVQINLLLHEAISRLRPTLCLCNYCLYELQVVSHIDLW